MESNEIILRARHWRQQFAIDRAISAMKAGVGITSVDLCILQNRCEVKKGAIGRLESALELTLPAGVMGQIFIRDSMADRLSVKSCVIHPGFTGFPTLCLENVWHEMVELSYEHPVAQLCFVKTLVTDTVKTEGNTSRILFK